MVKGEVKGGVCKGQQELQQGTDKQHSPPGDIVTEPKFEWNQLHRKKDVVNRFSEVQRDARILLGAKDHSFILSFF